MSSATASCCRCFSAPARPTCSEFQQTLATTTVDEQGKDKKGKRKVGAPVTSPSHHVQRTQDQPGKVIIIRVPSCFRSCLGIINILNKYGVEE